MEQLDEAHNDFAEESKRVTSKIKSLIFSEKGQAQGQKSHCGGARGATAQAKRPAWGSGAQRGSDA